MPIPWLRVFDALIGVADFALVRRTERRLARDEDERSVLESGGRALGHLETRLASVVVAALKEAFDRDSRRLEFEREQLQAERKRAERALWLERYRQAGDREIGRLRLTAVAAIAGWLATLLFAVELIGGPVGARVALGVGWALLIGALAAAFVGQSSVGQAISACDPDRDASFRPPVAGLLAPWLVVAGLALAGLAVLIV